MYSEPISTINSFHLGKSLLLTVTEVGAGVNFPNDLSLVRSVDTSILIVQKVLRQSLIWEKR